MQGIEIITDRSKLLSKIGEICSIADSYKNEIGFWTRKAIEERIHREQVIAATSHAPTSEVVTGFLIHGGVHPNAKIEAIAVKDGFLREGIAQRLLDTAIKYFQGMNYITVLAKPAKELERAQELYIKNNFEIIKIVPGGKRRKREIVVREKALGGPDLLDGISAGWAAKNVISTGTMSSRLWVIDVNVLLDATRRGRDRRQMANAVIAAVLSSEVQIAVTTEFKDEFQRNKQNNREDILLDFAMNLPTLIIDKDENISELADLIENLIFGGNKSLSLSKRNAFYSDCRHIAQCSLGHASGFITSDGPILRAANEIRSRFGLEVISLQDFCEALSSGKVADIQNEIVAKEFHIRQGNFNEIKKFIGCSETISHFRNLELDFPRTRKILTVSAYKMNNIPVGFLALQESDKFGDACKFSVVVDRTCENAEIITDSLVRWGFDALEIGVPHIVELSDLNEQALVRRVAYQLGFRKSTSGKNLVKLVIGAPITPGSIKNIVNRLRLLIGDNAASELLPQNFSDLDHFYKMEIKKFSAFERYLSPCLLASNNREFVIQSIKKVHADNLLGTSGQTNLFPQSGGSYRSDKVFACTENSKHTIRKNQIILFYESKRSGGGGAVTAAANVSSVVVKHKNNVSKQEMERTVLDTVENISPTDSVTLIKFNSLLRFPSPVSIKTLKLLGADDSLNYITAKIIPTKVGQKILDFGWKDV